MKAAVVYGANDIRISEVPTPRVGPGEVLVRVKGSGVVDTSRHLFSRPCSRGGILPVACDGGSLSTAHEAVVLDLDHQNPARVAVAPSQAKGVPELEDEFVVAELDHFCLVESSFW